MEPTTPILKSVDPSEEILLAANQPQYAPLRMLRVGGDNEEGNHMLTRWTFSPEERVLIANGADIHLFIIGYNHPPVVLQLTTD